MPVALNLLGPAKNLQTQCEGLSPGTRYVHTWRDAANVPPALFFFAIVGNLTYSLSIIAKSTERDYLITNASWLAGADFCMTAMLVILQANARECTNCVLGPHCESRRGESPSPFPLSCPIQVLGQFFWYRSLYVARQSAGGT
jgi:hypothetical protein